MNAICNRKNELCLNTCFHQIISFLNKKKLQTKNKLWCLVISIRDNNNNNLAVLVESRSLVEVDKLVIVVVILRQMRPDAVLIVQLIQVNLEAQAVWMQLDVLVHLHVVDIAWTFAHCTDMNSVVSSCLAVYDENQVHTILAVVLHMSPEDCLEATNGRNYWFWKENVKTLLGGQFG